MAKTAEELELEKQQSDAVLKANTEALREEAIRESNDALATKALEQTHADEASALADNNQSQYDNLGQIIGDIQGKIDAAKKKDEAAVKRENAYRYISGLGDTLSSVANLVGTAHGASNQQQTYNSHAVVQKAEQARKERKLEMDDLNKRLEEMSARQRDLKAAGSLAEAQLKAKQDRERFQLATQQRKDAEAARRYADTQRHTAAREARADWQADRAFKAQQEQWNKSYSLQLQKFNKDQEGKNYNFTFSDGSIDIPKEKINDVNIERIFQMLPAEVRDQIKGEAYTEYETDEYGTSVRKTGHKAPSLSQKLAAIGASADENPAIKDELRRLAGQTIPNSPASEESASGDKWGAFKVNNTTSAAPAPAPASTPAQPFYWNEKEKKRVENVEEAKNAQKNYIASLYK